MTEYAPQATLHNTAERHEPERQLPYEVVDLTEENPSTAVRYLQGLATLTAQDGSQKYVFHGAHTTGYHEADNLPEVVWNENLDPAYSRQDVQAVYATSSPIGAAIHATLKHRPEDEGPISRQTFALAPVGNGTNLTMSPTLQEAAGNGSLPFTDGYLYVLPADEFKASKHVSDHEVAADHAVIPALGIKLSKNIGPRLLDTVQISSFHEDAATLPKGFTFNPDFDASYEEQLQWARAEAAYQNRPIPSMEHVLALDIRPTFNPTEAPVEEIYARGRVPEKFRTQMGRATHAEKTDSSEPVEMWRIVDRSKLLDGSALISSAVQQCNSLGDVEHFQPVKHLSSDHEQRMTRADSNTPFVSFSSDPQKLARWIQAGFGTTEGRDSVVVQAMVDPSRVLTTGKRKEGEIFLLGGLSPDEYVAAYSVKDFVGQMSV